MPCGPERPCPENKVCNEKSRRCVQRTGRVGLRLARAQQTNGCPPGYIRNPATGRCVLRDGRIGRSLQQSPRPTRTKKCPPCASTKQICNPATGRCVTRTGGIGRRLVNSERNAMLEQASEALPLNVLNLIAKQSKMLRARDQLIAQYIDKLVQLRDHSRDAPRITEAQQLEYRIFGEVDDRWEKSDIRRKLQKANSARENPYMPDIERVQSVLLQQSPQRRSTPSPASNNTTIEFSSDAAFERLRSISPEVVATRVREFEQTHLEADAFMQAEPFYMAVYDGYGTYLFDPSTGRSILVLSLL